jgi:hypothetical protein
MHMVDRYIAHLMGDHYQGELFVAAAEEFAAGYAALCVDVYAEPYVVGFAADSELTPNCQIFEYGNHTMISTMKNIILTALSCIALSIIPVSNSSAIAQEISKSPMIILKSMSDNMGSKTKFSLNTTSFYDEKFENQMIKSMVRHRVDVVRPNTLYVESVFDDGEKWLGTYDGKTVRFYEPAKKEYSEIPFEGTVSEVADMMDNNGLSQTPLNDFMRKDFYADVEPDIFSATLIDGYVDPRDGDKETSHLLFESHGTVWQLWVGGGNYNLPRRLVVTYSEIGRPEYAVSFDSWSFDSKPEDLPAKYDIPTSLDGWKKVEFVNPINFK